MYTITIINLFDIFFLVHLYSFSNGIARQLVDFHVARMEMLTWTHVSYALSLKNNIQKYLFF